MAVIKGHDLMREISVLEACQTEWPSHCGAASDESSLVVPLSLGAGISPPESFRVTGLKFDGM
jgi:hypothetical protein